MTAKFSTLVSERIVQKRKLIAASVYLIFPADVWIQMKPKLYPMDWNLDCHQRNLIIVNSFYRLKNFMQILKIAQLIVSK